LSHITSSDEIEVVVLVARWGLYLAGERVINSFGFREAGPDTPAVVGRDSNQLYRRPNRISAVLDDLDHAILALIESGKRVVLVLPIPEPGWHVPKRLARLEMFGSDRARDISTERGTHEDRVRGIRRHFQDRYSPSVFAVVDPSSLFCADSYCLNSKEGVPIYADDDHLNSIGAAWLAEEISQVIQHFSQG
jgi:hypothetical protein